MAGSRDGRYHLVQLRAQRPGVRALYFWTKCLRSIVSTPDPNVATECGRTDSLTTAGKIPKRPNSCTSPHSASLEEPPYGPN